MRYPQFPPFRSFVLSDQAQKELDDAVSRDQRIEEQYRGVEWIIVRSPGDEYDFQVAPDVYLYRNKKARPDAALFLVLYAFDEDKIEVLRMWIR